VKIHEPTSFSSLGKAYSISLLEDGSRIWSMPVTNYLSPIGWRKA
jgi:hypothetical protein